MDYYVGVDIGGTKIAYGLFDESKQLIMKKVLPSDDKLVGEDFFHPIAQEIRLYQQVASCRQYYLRRLQIYPDASSLPDRPLCQRR